MAAIFLASNTCPRSKIKGRLKVDDVIDFLLQNSWSVMSAPSNKYRPATLVNLGDFVREGISAQQGQGSPPVKVPHHKSSRQSSSSRSAPASKHKTFRSPGPGPVGYDYSPSRGYSTSLVAPVLEEGEVLSTSATSTSSSVMIQRHRDAATGYGTMAQVGNGGGDGPGSPDPTVKSVNFENECIKIQMRNEGKRDEHATT